MAKFKEMIMEAIGLLESGGAKSKHEASRIIGEKYSYNSENIRKNMGRYEQKSQHKALEAECQEVGIPAEAVGNYWYKGKHFSIHAKNKPVTYDQIRDEIIHDMNEHSPIYPSIDREQITDGHLLVIDPADIHIGKLATSYETGEDYNSNIAVQRVLDGVRGIIKKANGFPIDKILFVGGNDILHTDNPRRQTTSGTPQDTDGMWYQNFLVAKQLYVDVLEMLIQVAPVHFVFNPSNHDYTNGFFLADVISSWFRNCQDISFDCSISHRKYFVYGSNLIGTTHGDGAKTTDLPLLMATEAPIEWSQTKHRYVYSHHLHHKVSKDINGICVESLRSPSGTDSWHHRNGYTSTKACEGFIHNKLFGQVARITHIF